MNGLSIFVPLYNEEDIIERNVLALIKYMNGLKGSYEVILGSNGSTDRTPEIGTDLSHTYSQVSFFHIEQRGPGGAFALALNQAAYPFILCQDADLSTDLNFIPQAMDLLETYDAVIGAKQVHTQKRPLFRVIASELFILFTDILLKMPYRDYSIGAKAYRIQAIYPFKDHIDRHTFYTQSLVFHLYKTGKQIIEIPVNCTDLRKSKFNLLHEGFYRYFKLMMLWQKTLFK
jgi:glycosyltransferase involved in cell wall biosynthesis